MDVFSLGLGGVLGAAAAAVVAALRLRVLFERFSSAFEAYFAGANDPASTELVEEYGRFRAGIHVFQEVWERLKRALRRR